MLVFISIWSCKAEDKTDLKFNLKSFIFYLPNMTVAHTQYPTYDKSYAL